MHVSENNFNSVNYCLKMNKSYKNDDVSDDNIEDDDVDQEEDDDEQENESYLETVIRDIVEEYGDYVRDYISNPGSPEEIIQNESIKNLSS